MRLASFRLSTGRTARDDAPWRKPVALLAFLSVFWMSLVAQTHFHPVAPSAGAAKILVQTGGQASPVKAPASGDTNDCPLCQAVSQGSAFIAPHFFSLIVISLAQASPSWIAPPAKWSAFPGHDRQSRAPPRL
ncbi:MAG TPA: hypothetical protein VGC16_00555 [Rhizomicrobium sp.]